MDSLSSSLAGLRDSRDARGLYFDRIDGLYPLRDLKKDQTVMRSPPQTAGGDCNSMKKL